MPDPFASTIVQAAAIITATAAVGTCGFAAGIYRLVRKHDRVLFGEESVEAWNGLVGEVRANKNALEEEGIR